MASFAIIAIAADLLQIYYYLSNRDMVQPPPPDTSFTILDIMAGFLRWAVERTRNLQIMTSFAVVFSTIGNILPSTEGTIGKAFEDEEKRGVNMIKRIGGVQKLPELPRNRCREILSIFLIAAGMDIIGFFNETTRFREVLNHDRSEFKKELTKGLEILYSAVLEDENLSDLVHRLTSKMNNVNASTLWPKRIVIWLDIFETYMIEQGNLIRKTYTIEQGEKRDIGEMELGFDQYPIPSIQLLAFVSEEVVVRRNILLKREQDMEKREGNK